MAYNTTTERLLNAIKNNTASISIGDVNAIDAETKTAILETELSNDVIVTNTNNINASVQALQGDNALNPGTSVTLEDLRLLLNTIDADTGNIDTSLNNIETNSDTSLGKNGFSFHTGNATGQSGKAAVQFVTESVVTGITGTSISGATVEGTFPAGTIIYGDITDVSISSGRFILYNV